MEFNPDFTYKFLSNFWANILWNRRPTFNVIGFQEQVLVQN
jgi:hypothetical protein